MMHFWKVRFTVPTKLPHESIYLRNVSSGVAADTIDEAIAEVRSKFPCATIYGVTHQGKIELIVPSNP